jgi:hypothetical protein
MHYFVKTGVVEAVILKWRVVKTVIGLRRRGAGVS